MNAKQLAGFRAQQGKKHRHIRRATLEVERQACKAVQLEFGFDLEPQEPDPPGLAPAPPASWPADWPWPPKGPRLKGQSG